MLYDYMTCPKCDSLCAFIMGTYDCDLDRVRYRCTKCGFKALLKPADHPDRKGWLARLWTKWF